MVSEVSASREAQVDAARPGWRPTAERTVMVAAVSAAGYGYAAAVGAPPLPRRWAFRRTYAGQKDTAVRLAAKYVRHLVRTR